MYRNEGGFFFFPFRKRVITAFLPIKIGDHSFNLLIFFNAEILIISDFKKVIYGMLWARIFWFDHCSLFNMPPPWK